MKSVKSIVVSGSTPSHLGKRLSDFDALCHRIRDSLPAPLNQHLKATVMQSGVLSLFVASPVWASRLRYTIPQLTENLQNQGLMVEQVRIRILPDYVVTPSRSRSEKLTLSRDNSEMLRHTAAAIRDPELSEALLKLSRHGEKH